MFSEWGGWMEQLAEQAGVMLLGGIEQAKQIPDVVTFAREWLGFPVDEIQALVLRAGRRVIVNCTRQWGKSTVAAAKAVYRAFTKPGSLILVVAPTLRQSGELIRKAEEFVRRLGIPVRGDGTNALSIAFPNGSRIVGLPGNASTTRGFSNPSLVIFEEAAWIPDELYQAIRPTLATGDGDLCLISTPYWPQGFFHEEWAHGGPGWERICVPATECPRINQSFLDEERGRLDEKKFLQEYMCQFAEVTGRIFSREAIEDALAEDYEGIEL